MFECDLDELDTAAVLTAAAEFARIQEKAAVGVLQAALAFADRNAVLEDHPDDPLRSSSGGALPGLERLCVYGGDGCPGVAEFAPIEFGAVVGMSSGAAASLMGEALALRHRLPRVWAAVLAGKAAAWRARKIADACLALSLEAAAVVDRQVAGIVNTVTPGALARITKAAVLEADPDRAQAEAEAAARTRGVFVAQSDLHGTKQIWVRAAAGDVIRFDATIDDLARALKVLGDTDSLDQRRAKAVGWIADPAAARELIDVARHLARAHTDSGPTPPTRRTQPDRAASDTSTATADGAANDSRDAGGHGAADAFTRQALAGSLSAKLAQIKQDAYSNGLGAGSRHTMYVHLTDHTLATGTGVLRVEQLGPLLASQLSELLGHDQVVVKPVIDLRDQVSVHSYEIPDRLRERVRLRHPVDMFPYGGAEATNRMDQDHIRPYDRTGPPGQTSLDNLIPLTRLHHRAKTFGGWSNRRLPSGAIEWTTRHGFRFLVDRLGTHPLPHCQPERPCVHGSQGLGVRSGRSGPDLGSVRRPAGW
ncbi:HNH endonuclease signature motif containing protein [Kribbella sp. GL6]|uniref:HNH endonuclease signature motif containing protein n=1 Tax=Kribbella sp. GL6 TaxID=3419765 RepID=UPI003CFE6384